MEDNRSNEELIEEMLRNAKDAPEPGKNEKVVDKGSDNTGPIVVSSLKSAGYAYVFDNKTGERSIVNRNMLMAQLRKKRDDGSFVFTTVNPKIVPWRGKSKCMLHVDDPNRAHYDEMGLPKCRKANITSPFQVVRHMEKRHKAEYAAIKSEKADAERAEEKEYRRSVLDLSRSRKAEELPFSDPPKEDEEKKPRRKINHRKKKE